MRHQLKIMLELQEEMNKKVHPAWYEQGFEWYRAIWIESAELMDHIGWKWWKKQDSDIQQVHLEVIDIWHFGLSLILNKTRDISGVIDQIEEVFNQKNVKGDIRQSTELFAKKTLEYGNSDFDLNGFYRICCDAGITFEQLYKSYIGKNVLNFFRQDHGYKEGHYKKVWRDREDNEHLVEILETIDCSAPDFKDHLYDALKRRYTMCIETCSS